MLKRSTLARPRFSCESAWPAKCVITLRECVVLMNSHKRSDSLQLYAALPPFDALTGLKLLQRQKTFNLEVKLEGVDRDGYLYLFREAGRVRSTTKPLSGA